MAVETADDRSYLLADFGVDVTIGGSTIKAIFDNDYQPVDAGGGVPFAIQQAMILCRSADVTSIAEGSLLTIAGSSYAVTDIQPDGEGMTMLALEAQ